MRGSASVSAGMFQRCSTVASKLVVERGPAVGDAVHGAGRDEWADQNGRHPHPLAGEVEPELPNAGIRWSGAPRWGDVVDALHGWCGAPMLTKDPSSHR